MELTWKPTLFSDLIEYSVSDIPDDEWERSDVGHIDGTRSINVEERDSFIWTKRAAAIWPPYDEKMILKQMGITEYSLVDMEVLKYERGSLFKEHIDRTRYDNHVGTLLLIGYSEDAVGGDLVVKDTSVVHKTSNVEQWFMTFVPLGTVHSVTPLLHGTRYVIKFSVRNDVAYTVHPRRTRMEPTLLD